MNEIPSHTGTNIFAIHVAETIGEMSTDLDRLFFMAALLLELLCEHEQTPVGDCFAAAHSALLDQAIRRPPPPPPEPPPWNANPNVVALNAKLVEVQNLLDNAVQAMNAKLAEVQNLRGQLDNANQRWRDLERQRAEDQARRDFDERFPGAGAG